MYSVKYNSGLWNSEANFKEKEEKTQNHCNATAIALSNIYL